MHRLDRFAVSFVQSAMQYGMEACLKQHTRDVAGLKRFVALASIMGMNCENSLEAIFANHSGSEPPVPIQWSDEKRRELMGANDEKERKDKIMEKIQVSGY